MDVLEIYEAAGICSLPINPLEAARALGIKAVSYRTFEKEYSLTARELYEHSRFGFSFKIEQGFVIVINENSCGERRRRFTAAHELAHCVLGHLEREAQSSDEREADRFAAEFLAPMTVLNFCGAASAKEIAAMCGISDSAAKIAFDELSQKRRRGFDFLENERNAAIMRRFSKYITRRLEERSFRVQQNCAKSYR